MSNDTRDRQSEDSVGASEEELVGRLEDLEVDQDIAAAELAGMEKKIEKAEARRDRVKPEIFEKVVGSYYRNRDELIRKLEGIEERIRGVNSSLGELRRGEEARRLRDEEEKKQKEAEARHAEESRLAQEGLENLSGERRRIEEAMEEPRSALEEIEFRKELDEYESEEDYQEAVAASKKTLADLGSKLGQVEKEMATLRKDFPEVESAEDKREVPTAYHTPELTDEQSNLTTKLYETIPDEEVPLERVEIAPVEEEVYEPEAEQPPGPEEVEKPAVPAEEAVEVEVGQEDKEEDKEEEEAASPAEEATIAEESPEPAPEPEGEETIAEAAAPTVNRVIEETIQASQEFFEEEEWTDQEKSFFSDTASEAFLVNPCLVLQDPSGQEKIFELIYDTMIIGSAGVGEVDISIPHPTVDKKHARIKLERGRYVIKDLRSRNGTFINGKKTRKSPLRHMDKLKVGDIFFQVRLP